MVPTEPPKGKVAGREPQEMRRHFLEQELNSRQRGAHRSGGILSEEEACVGPQHPK